MSDRDLRRAEAEARAAHKRLALTMSEIQDRLNPRVLMHEAWADLRAWSDQAAGDAVDKARANPAATAGVAAVISLLVLRHPLGRIVARLFFDRNETESGDGRLKPGRRDRVGARRPAREIDDGGR